MDQTISRKEFRAFWRETSTVHTFNQHVQLWYYDAHLSPCGPILTNSLLLGGSFGKFGGGGAALQRQPADGSYDASDFGGGFQGTQDTGVGGSSPRSPKRSGAIVQTLTPVTVRQLQLAQHSHPDDIFKVDDRELNQVSLTISLPFQPRLNCVIFPQQDHSCRADCKSSSAVYQC